MKKAFILFLLTVSLGVYSQKLDTLNIYYLNNSSFAFPDNGTVSGIEADIIKEYAAWLKAKKNISVYLNFKSFDGFEALYNAVKKGDKKVIGMSTAAINPEREKEVDFSPPYMKNVSVCITNGTAGTIRDKSSAEVNRVLGKLTAVSIPNSTFNTYLTNLKKTLIPGLKITNVTRVSEILESIASNPGTFGYVDVVEYWYYLKNNPNKYLKMQKELNMNNERFGFIMPKGNLNKDLLGEFFESGFGFTTTKTYHQILEKYLSYEVLQTVEVD
ncbi:MAG: transporter substrate-binding domain-containing protein [Sediminibacterium sp.]|nr:transporter substrate-binding domain-containing protein [Sediminibacterium sp.]